MICLTDADGHEKYLDCRPSDAIAIALRAKVPIYISHELMQQYGIMPEPDVRTRHTPEHAENNDEDEDLSAFSDFLSNF